MQILETEMFQLELSLTNYGQDASEKETTILNVRVFSDDFSAAASRAIHLNVFCAFVEDLKKLAKTGCGKAGMHAKDTDSFIEFEGDGSDRIRISGKIASTGNSGFTQKLTFQNDFSRERLTGFADALFNGYCLEQKETTR